MRIAAFADSHQFHDELVVPDADVLVCAGDVCRGGEREELENFLGWFERLPHRHKIFVAGNHDGCLERERLDVIAAHSDVTFLEDDGVTIDGVSFWGSPWTPEFHDWAFMLPRGRPLKKKWALIPVGVDVLITHGPPHKILDDAGAYRNISGPERWVGCEELRERVVVVKPRVHLFGHIHSQPGSEVIGETRFFNCTTNECEIPCTVLDVEPR